MGVVGGWSWMLVVAAVAAGLFRDSLSGPFVYDDLPCIVNNPHVNQGLATMGSKEFWLADYWGRPLVDPLSHKSWRPLTSASFALEVALFGLEPWFMHAHNMALHALNTFLLAWLACQLAQRLGFEPVAAHTWALMVALLFATHPMHTEAVSNITNRAELLALTCQLMGLAYLSVTAWSAPPTQKSAAPAKPRQSAHRRHAVVATLCALLAALCKETGIMATAIYVAYELLLQSNHAWQWAHKFSALVWMARPSTASTKERSRPVNRPRLSSQPTLPNDPALQRQHTLSLTYLNAFHLRLLHRTPSSPWARLWALALAWLVLPFLPASNLFFYVGFTVAERVTYTPSIGFCMLLATMLCWSTQWLRSSRRFPLLLLLTALLVGAYVPILVERDGDWGNELRLWQASTTLCPSCQSAYLRGLEANPHYFHGHLNLGKLYREELRDSRRALHHIEQAIRSAGRSMVVWHAKALCHEDLGEFAEAVTAYQTAARVSPPHAERFLQAAQRASAQQAQPTHTVKSTPIAGPDAQRHDNDSLAPIKNPRSATLPVQPTESALDLYEQAAAYAQRQELGLAMPLLSRVMKDENASEQLSQALTAFEQAVQIKHNETYVLNYALTLNRLGQLDKAVTGRGAEAEQVFRQAVATPPPDASADLPEDQNLYRAKAYVNLGVLAYQQGQDVVAAREAFRQALYADPTHATARRNLQALEGV
ncbi:uncharacterized protein MONBRDRAFT_29929 [Monosiga brevicollis MX1]|uniref:Dolichyl-phosphate-mannose--protein mannosyltransferase n=1 Tax=Monosiga brevicollis TaxID=81824 RepID=A9VCJ0_MONBE|nr:uncharacterized protein MONBRDRAFT_29929 [Monosiga brevicollis MX1]EDQ84794.1 predicted protein [Monosiga brevicollis MX1]|eukprot:XP_001750444.1 hypothetical protein [Monosiga brevicollis MX1]